LTSEPALACAWIIVGEHMRRAGVPATSQPVSQLQSHARMVRNVADVSRFCAVFCDDPELLADLRQTQSKQKPN